MRKVKNLRIKIPRELTHEHNYGKISTYFHGLGYRKIMLTMCQNAKCERPFVYLPPRADCPYCWEAMKWLEFKSQLVGRVATFSVVNYPGAGYEEDIAKVDSKLPSIIVYVEFPGVDTKIMSRLENCDPKDVRMGMEVEARFWDGKSLPIKRGYTDVTCLNLYFVPVKK